MLFLILQDGLRDIWSSIILIGYNRKLQTILGINLVKIELELTIQQYIKRIICCY